MNDAPVTAECVAPYRRNDKERMSAIAKSTGNGKSPQPRVEKPMSLDEACDFLRAALHYIAIAGGEIQVENDAVEGLKITVKQVAFTEDESGDMFFVPISPLQPSIATPLAAAA